MRIWAKIYHGEKLTKSKIFEDERPLDPTSFERSILDLCGGWDIPTPILLKCNYENFRVFHITSFKRDDFVEQVDFDKLVLEDASV